jgi:hypothetical protein
MAVAAEEVRARARVRVAAIAVMRATMFTIGVVLYN